MAKGESGIETAQRIACMLEDYISSTPIEKIPQYRGKASESAIATILGVDRKRFKSSFCSPLMASLHTRVEQFYADAEQDAEDTSAKTCPDYYKSSDPAVANQLRAAERRIRRLERDLKTSDEKINKLTGRVSLLTLQLEDERQKRHGKNLHHRKSVRTLHVN